MNDTVLGRFFIACAVRRSGEPQSREKEHSKNPSVRGGSNRAAEEKRRLYWYTSLHATSSFMSL